MADLVVLYDGWSLVFEPNQPAALHLSLLLENLPDQVRPVVALPGNPFDLLPSQVEQVVQPTLPTPAGRLAWEQHALPGLAKKTAARVLHLFSGAPLFSMASRSVFSPAGYTLPAGLGDNFPEIAPPGSAPGLLARIREALWQSSLDRAGIVLWPADLPAPETRSIVHTLPIIQPSSAWQRNIDAVDLQGLDLPESFVLYHGPSHEPALRRMLDAWSWAADPIGQSCPLMVIGLPREARQCLAELVSLYQLGETVRSLPELPLAALLAVFRRCGVVFHPAPLAPWGDGISLALGYARPVVAVESPWTDARLGPAAYLIRPGESLKATSRALGAALVTVIVEESVSDGLVAKAGQRSATWERLTERIPKLLIQAYSRL